MPIQDVEERRRGWGGCWRNARTFTAATFFAHLLTLRMFGVYFFNPVTLRKDKKRKNEEGDKRHFLLVFTPSSCFFLYIISICMFVCFCTHCDTSLESRDSTLGGVLEGTLLGEFTLTFAFITAKTEKQNKKNERPRRQS